jgi:hypothetical protein
MRPLAPPYSLHTVLLKVESYNDLVVRGAPAAFTEKLAALSAALDGATA